MLKQIILATAVSVIVGCGGSGGGDSTPAPTSPTDPAPTGPNPTPNPVPTNPPTGPTTDQPTGTVVGSWIGDGDFGRSVYIVDSNQVLYGFSDDGGGRYKSLFGVVTAPIERFDHRISDNPAFGNGFTVVGDTDPNFPSVSYTFTVSADGLSMTNDSDFGSFNMTLQQSNPITVAEIAGNWASNTSFCATCPLQLLVSVAATGEITGQTSFGLEGALDPATTLTLAGSVSDSGQYLGVQFNWDGKQRTGVIYRQEGTQNLILNTFGFESDQDGNKAFSALLSRTQ